MTTSFNTKNPAVKRILSEIKELQSENSSDYTATPLEDNLFEWHFTVRGPEGTDFQNGIYHGRIILPTEYPFKPPSIILLTPNGRFECNKKICLSITGFHPEYWAPAWGIRTAILALVSFFPTKAEGAIGGIDWKPEERRELAISSLNWTCSVCGICNRDILPEHCTSSSKRASEKDDVDLSIFSLSYEKQSAAGNQVKGKEAENNMTIQQNIVPKPSPNTTPESSNNGSDVTADETTSTKRENLTTNTETDSSGLIQRKRNLAQDLKSDCTTAVTEQRMPAAPKDRIYTPQTINHNRSQRVVDLVLLLVLLIITPLVLRRVLLVLSSLTSTIQ